MNDVFGQKKPTAAEESLASIASALTSLQREADLNYELIVMEKSRVMYRDILNMFKIAENKNEGFDFAKYKREFADVPVAIQVAALRKLLRYIDERTTTLRQESSTPSAAFNTALRTKNEAGITRLSQQNENVRRLIHELETEERTVYGEWHRVGDGKRLDAFIPHYGP